MATPKAAKNAAKAATSKGDAAAKAGDVNPFALPKGETALRNIAQQLKISTGQVKDLYGSIIPELQAAGTPNATIKGFLQQQDAHLAAKQYLAGEKAELVDQLVALNAGFTPESLAKTPLRELWTTFEDASKPAQEQASKIRGKVDEPTTTESRLPGENTATADATLGETPKPEAAGAPKGEGGPPNAKDRKRVKWEQRQKSAANAATAREGNWEGVDWQGSNRDSSYAGRTAANGDWSRLRREDFTGERNSPNPTIELNRGAAGAGQASARATGAEALAEAPAKPAGPPVTETDEVLKYGSRMLPFVQEQFKKRPAVATAVTTVGLPFGALVARHGIPAAYRGLSNLYGAAFGPGEAAPATGQQQQSPAGGGPRIQILPRSELQRRESMPPARQAPPPMQQPMPPQQAAPASPSPGQTTDIIRMLSGRMA